jgi:hypothetical protein
METLIQQPGVSIWEASENRAEAKAIYRMLGNAGFEQQKIIRAHREATDEQMSKIRLQGDKFHKNWNYTLQPSVRNM